MKLKIENKDIDAAKLICVGQSQDNKGFCVVSPDATFIDALSLLQTLSLHILNAYTISANGGPLKDNPSSADLDKMNAIRQSIYEAFNQAASSVLELYAPELELRPDITTEAIQDLEAKKIKERYSHLSPKEKEDANIQIQKLQKSLLRDKMRRANHHVTDKVS